MSLDPPPPSEAVTFIQYQLPGLPAGTYELGVRVHVDASDGTPINDQPLAHAYRFAVLGDRFSLSNPAATVFALFPADNASGAFDTTFAHVVLSRPGLPWIRYPTLTPPLPDAASQGVPTWLAVLVLDEDDVATAQEPFDLVPKVATVGDLFPPSVWPSSTLEATTCSYFSHAGHASAAAPVHSGLDAGQAYDDAVQIIDLPLALFAAIAPTCKDLELTAHVRRVSVSNKASATAAAAPAASPSEPGGTYAVVMGNRLPQANMKSHAYLVSLEGLQPLLPTDEGGAVAGLDRFKNIRLAVLQHWTFFSMGSEAAFEEQLQRLNGRQPGDKPAADTTVSLPLDGATGAVASALPRGYVPLDHRLRAGGNTVSWYRGPLASADTVAAPPPLPITSADAVMAFDPTTGMLDVTLAAAWTLGRLVALDDTTFSTALYNWKQGLKREVVVSAERRLIEEEYGMLRAQEGAMNLQGLPLLHHTIRLLAKSEPT
jgi:hypothetical protein